MRDMDNLKKKSVKDMPFGTLTLLEAELNTIVDQLGDLTEIAGDFFDDGKYDNDLNHLYDDAFRLWEECLNEVRKREQSGRE